MINNRGQRLAGRSRLHRWHCLSFRANGGVRGWEVECSGKAGIFSQCPEEPLYVTIRIHLSSYIFPKHCGEQKTEERFAIRILLGSCQGKSGRGDRDLVSAVADPSKATEFTHNVKITAFLRPRVVGKR